MARWSSPYWKPLEAFGWHSSRMAEGMPLYFQVTDLEGLMYISAITIVYAHCCHMRCSATCVNLITFAIVSRFLCHGTCATETSMAPTTAVVVEFLRPDIILPLIRQRPWLWCSCF